MADQTMTSDFYRVFERVRIPFLLTNSDLSLIYANQFAREVLPLTLKMGTRIEVDDSLQHEDSMAFENMVAECKAKGESVGTLRQGNLEKYYKVKAYCLDGRDGDIVFQFEDVSQSRILEDQMYEHLIELYNRLETQEREITDLRARVLKSD